MSWTAIFTLAAGAYLFKAIGLVLVGPILAGRQKPGSAEPGFAIRATQLMPPALLAALVASQTLVTDTTLVVDARLAGVCAGAVAVWRKAPFWLVLVIAAAVTAGVRQL